MTDPSGETIPRFLLDPSRLAEAERRFLALGWMKSGEHLRTLTKAGDGNMNCTLRADVGGARTFIVKQGRPWVEKYPTIAAPADRTLIEGAFYRTIGRNPELAARMPGMVGLDVEARLLALEDLGSISDLTSLYAGQALEATDLRELADFLCRLHATDVDDGERQTFRNEDMRRLNHEHIFDLPFRVGNGLNLDAITPGLGEIAERIAADRALVEMCSKLGAIYLAPGRCLVHGDYFPGSWIRTDRGLRIIDPEFGFWGPPELDLGVGIGHLILAGRPAGDLAAFLDHYVASAIGDGIDRDLVFRFAGVEILRRLLGVAQLPLPADLAKKQALVERARLFVVES